MTTRQTLILAGIAAFLLAPASAAEGPPSLDVTATCKSAGRASVSDTSSEEGCLRSEREARDEASRRWADFTPAAKRQCGKQSQAGGSPSYVEMVTCLELASGTVPTQLTDGKPQGERVKAGSGALTDAPDPNRRTNPIDVLGKPGR